VSASGVPDRLIIEADGGSRGNPGPAAYGVVVREAHTGHVLAERGKYLGEVTNNVAEYSGLVAGIETALGINSSAFLDIRMDSRLVVQQMLGRWKIKHEDMRRLATLARSLLTGASATFTWVPRARNAGADRLVNEAIDARGAVSRDYDPPPPPVRKTPLASDGATRVRRPAAGAAQGTGAADSGADNPNAEVEDHAGPRGDRGGSGGAASARTEGRVRGSAGGTDGLDAGVSEGVSTEGTQGENTGAASPGATRPGGSSGPSGVRGERGAGLGLALPVTERRRRAGALSHGARSGRYRSLTRSRPTTVLLARHGSSELTDAETTVFSGAVVPGPPLSPRGREQADALGGLIERVAVRGLWSDVEPPIALLTSPTLRTRETAAAVGAVIGLEAVPDYSFIEANFGDWDGLTAEQVEEQWPRAARRWFTDPDFHPEGDGESLNEVYTRLKRGLTRVVETYPVSTIVVVSHAIAIRAALGVALGAPAQAWMRFRVAPASLTAMHFWPAGDTEVLAHNWTLLDD
jgi:probable phosphoglycerate mutase